MSAPSLALLAALVAQVEDANVDFARQRFQRGLALYDEGRFDEALVEFQASVGLYASPNSNLYVARCLRALGRLAEAFAQYERTVGLAADRAGSDPRYQETRLAAEAELRALERQIGRLRLEVGGLPPGTRVVVGDREIPEAGWGLLVPVAPGRITVRAEAPGAAPRVEDVEVAAGAMAVVDLRPPSATPPPLVAAPAPARPPGRLSPWTKVSLAIGTAGMASFATFYLLAERQHDGLADRCGRAPCPPGERDAIDRGRLYQALTNGSLVVGVTGLLAGAALWTFAPSGGESVTVAVAPASLLLRARF